MKSIVRYLAGLLVTVVFGVVFTACDSSDSADTPPAGDLTNSIPATGDTGSAHTTLTGKWSCHITALGVTNGTVFTFLDQTVALQLDQSGGNLAGMLGEIPLTGTVHGHTVDIAAPGDNARWYLRGEFNDSITEIIGGDLNLYAPSEASSPYMGSWRAWR